MSRYIRCRQAGGRFFFTVVAEQRRPIFTNAAFRQALHDSIVTLRRQQAFEVNAWVLLPDHMHCIWTLPENDTDYSSRWGKIKAGVSKRIGAVVTARPGRRYESGIWQRRFWEHRIRDDSDYQRHMDYLLFNPVKHGLVARVADWPYSSFHRLVRDGVYPLDWAGVCTMDGDFGE
ncbi:MAG TPA: transposase [Pseudomonadales bacterium]